ncbi:MAG: hypothetical protein ACETVZ_01625 [Phycisphaerae bacterium]
MKEPFQKIFILAIGVAIALGAGCQEQELPSEKKSRLIAAEKIQLKNELEQRGKEIKSLKKQHDKEIKQLKEELTKCQKQKEVLEKQLQENVEEKVDDILSAVVDENTKLREEIKKLKAQIEKLKKELEDSEAKSRLPKEHQPL